LVVYSPYIEQVVAVREEIEKLKFVQIKTVENIVREWRVGKHTLPEPSGILHTGFLTFARKLN
jgi:tRNA A58 N-methylase Trm61